MFLNLIASFAQVSNTERFVEDLRKRLEVAIEGINQNNHDAAKSEINYIENQLAQFIGFEKSAISTVEEKHKAELGASNQQIESDKNKITELSNKINELELKIKLLESQDVNATAKAVADIISANDTKTQDISRLGKEKSQLIDENKNLLEKNESLTIRLTTSEERLKSSTEKNNELQVKIDKFSSAVKFGLSIGFNYYFNNQKDYIVQIDSTVKELGSGNGASGIISGVVSIRLTDDNRHNLVVNIPLGDFTSGSDRAVGIFNNRIAVGLGYAYAPFQNSAPNLSFKAIFNMSPYQKIDYDLIQSSKVSLPNFSKLKPEDFGATSAVSYSFTLGIVYSFIGTGSKN